MCARVFNSARACVCVCSRVRLCWCVRALDVTSSATTASRIWRSVLGITQHMRFVGTRKRVSACSVLPWQIRCSRRDYLCVRHEGGHQVCAVRIDAGAIKCMCTSPCYTGNIHQGLAKPVNTYETPKNKRRHTNTFKNILKQTTPVYERTQRKIITNTTIRSQIHTYTGSKEYSNLRKKIRSGID